MKIIAICCFALLCAGVQAGQSDQFKLDSAFLEARKAFQSGNATLLAEKASLLQRHALAPYIDYYQIRMVLRSIDTETIRNFLTRYEDALVGERLRAEWLKLLAQNQQWAMFESEFDRLVNKDTELLCYAYQHGIARNDADAQNKARQLWFTADSMPDSCTPVFNTLIAGRVITTDDQWARIRLALEAGKTSMANFISRRLPTNEALDRDELNAAAQNPLHYLKTRQSKIKTRSDREIALFALLRLLSTDTNPALAKWLKIKDALTPSDQSYFLARLGYRAAMRHDARALGWFKAAHGTKTPHPMTDTLLAWQVRAALRAGDWDTVLDAIYHMSADEQADGTWRYWRARALKEKGLTLDANTILIPLSKEHNYYGQLAKEELGTILTAAKDSVPVTAAEIQAMEKIPGIQRTLAFYRMDLRTEAYREWVWTIRNFNDRQLLAASAIAQRYGHYDRSINTANRTTHEHDFRLRFPTPHRETLRPVLKEQEIDEAWVYGIIRQESRFLINVTSSAGARGLMQLMPDTAKWVAKQLGMVNFQQNLVTQVDINLRLGTYYLKHVYTSLNNQSLLASAAYNAGPGRARRWRDDEKILEGAIYAETIPFSETRDYVKKVLKNSVYYANVLEHDYNPPTLKERLGIVGKK